MNHGLILEPFRQADYVFGTVSKEVLNPKGDWTRYLPEYENQKSSETGFDTFGCVSYSALNCLEILYNFHGQKRNFSDRFTVKMSRTIPQRGNTMRKVAESIRLDGMVDEEDYPFVDTQKEYYQPVPEEVKEKAEVVDVHWEHLSYPKWHDNRDKVLIEGLQYGPLQVAVYAWEKPVDGIYQHTDKLPGHVVTLFNYKEGEYWEIYDHYRRAVKKLAWDYEITAPLLYSLGGTVDIAKKYAGKLIKNPDDPNYYYSNGKDIAWIKNERSFEFGTEAGWWDGWYDVTEINTPIKYDLIY